MLSPPLKKGKILTGHLLIILAVILFLTFLYSKWPWREYTPYGLWEYPGLFRLASLEFKYHFVGSLFTIPILYATVVFRWRGALVAFLMSLAGLLPLLLSIWSNLESLIINITFLFIPMAIILIIYLALEQRARERQTFIEREKAHQSFVSQVIEAQENERQRIARELHDETIQTLSVIASRLETYANSDCDGKELARTKDSVIQTIDDLRRISRDLRPPTLDRLGILSALHLLISQINKEHDILVSLTVKGEEYKLPPNVEIHIFRIVQEALTNIRRHARATEAAVVLEFSKHGQLNITVRDNGQGFDNQETTKSISTQNKFGLAGMRERVRLVNGTLQIRTAPSKGTELSIRITNHVAN